MPATSHVKETLSSRAVTITVVGAGVLAGLYYGQIVLIPIALAMLLAFILTPPVRALQRLGLGLILSILLVGVATYSLLGVTAWAVSVQGGTLVRAIPQYRDNIRQKIVDIRGFGRGGAVERLQRTIEQATREARQEETKKAPKAADPVVVTRDSSWSLWDLPAALGPWLPGVAAGGLVALLAPFLILERVSLRDRVIRFMGRRRMAVTTRALDEAGERVSRYLLMQTMVNGSYGVLVAVGLLLLGLPYAVLWGFLAALLRFIPYVGPWIAALLPLILSLAVFEGWTRPLLAAGLFVALEVFMNMVLETVLYAGSAGVSQAALLIAIAFWTMIWGPIGLVLATPLTVCLVVFGKYVPELRFFSILMSDERVVSPDVGFYQRILADDFDDAVSYVEEYVKEHPASDVADDVMLPALQHARQDLAAGAIGSEDEARIVRAIGRAAEQVEAVGASVEDPSMAQPPAERVTVLGCPALDSADEVALRILARRLETDGTVMEVLPAMVLTAEVVRDILTRRPHAVIIGSLPPGGLAETRFLCKRLQATEPTPWILVARWRQISGTHDENAALLAVGATAVIGSLVEAREQLGQFSRIARGSDRHYAAPVA